MHFSSAHRFRNLPLLALLTVFGAASALAQPSLFRGPGAPENPGPNVVVRHGIDVAAEVLSNNPAQLWIDLPDAPAILVQQTGFEQRRGNGLVWRGNVPYASDSQVVLTRHKGLLAGTIQIDGDTYEVAPGPGRSQVIQKLDIAAFPACEGGPIAPTAAGDTAGGGGSTSTATAGAADPNAEMHLLAMYTPQARDGAGGVAGIEATIQAAVDNANTALANSNMLGRYVLVHTALANYNDSGSLSSDLYWLDDDPAVAAFRNEYGADMVSLIVDSGGCGIGYVQRAPGPGFAAYAFQVTVRNCAVGNLTFAHEHGHNLGFEHDPANSNAYPSGGSYPWSFGAVVGANLARTVMTYPGACNNCPRVMHHSNPDISYQGFPTGNATDGDNARTGDTTAYIVHDFREAVNAANLVSISVAPATADIDTGATQQLTATGHYDDASTSDLTFDVSWTSSNTGVVTVDSAGLATGQGAGSAGIAASLDGVTSSTATINVTDPPPATLESITVNPSNATIGVGATQSFTATGNYSDSSTQDLTSQAAWTSSNTGVATVSAGVATGVAAGTASITASFEGFTSNTAALSVNAPFSAHSFSPSLVNPDVNVAVTVTGSGFTPGATISFQGSSGQSPSVSNVSVNSSQITATIYAPGNGPKRDRVWDVVVTNGDSQSQVLAGALTVTFNPIANNPPTVSISSPVNGSSLALGAQVSFSGSANDTEDGDISANLAWTSSLDGSIGSGASFSTAGLSEGVHTITASVSDSGGASGNASVSMTIGDPNTAPNVTISSPGNGSAFTAGDSVSFSGSANDAEDGDVSTGLSWASSLDGLLGSGASFGTAALSVGTHTITATASDSGSLTGQASITVTINSNNPGVTVDSVSPGSVSRNTQPTLTVTGSGFAAGAAVSFENGSGPSPGVLSVSFVDSTQLQVTVDVPKGGSGARTWDVRVTNPGGASGVLQGGLTVGN